MESTRFVLHPDHAAKQGATWTPDSPIPSSLRTFGKFPNVHEWLPGDLLLVRSVDPDPITRKIIAAQVRAGYAPDDARWQHAAIFMGDIYITEATTRGVKFGELYPYVGHYEIRVRRDPSLNADERWRLAIQAGFRLGNSYNFADIMRLYRKSFSGFWRALHGFTSQDGNSVICSQLYALAHSVVAPRRLLVPLNEYPVTPAALSRCAYLDDVSTYWSSIPE